MKERNRSFVSLLTAFSFVVLVLTGILAFIRPFSIQIVGLHALIGFIFVGLIALHVANNFNHLSRYMRTRILWSTLATHGSLPLATSADTQHPVFKSELGPCARQIRDEGQWLGLPLQPFTQVQNGPDNSSWKGLRRQDATACRNLAGKRIVLSHQDAP